MARRGRDLYEEAAKTAEAPPDPPNAGEAKAEAPPVSPSEGEIKYNKDGSVRKKRGRKPGSTNAPKSANKYQINNVFGELPVEARVIVANAGPMITAAILERFAGFKMSFSPATMMIGLQAFEAMLQDTDIDLPPAQMYALSQIAVIASGVAGAFGIFTPPSENAPPAQTNSAPPASEVVIDQPMAATA
jgi:hypothetical protein